MRRSHWSTGRGNRVELHIATRSLGEEFVEGPWALDATFLTRGDQSHESHRRSGTSVRDTHAAGRSVPRSFELGRRGARFSAGRRRSGGARGEGPATPQRTAPEAGHRRPRLTGAPHLGISARTRPGVHDHRGFMHVQGRAGTADDHEPGEAEPGEAEPGEARKPAGERADAPLQGRGGSAALEVVDPLRVADGRSSCWTSSGR